ncbi:MAG TPA: polyprenyl synthetase family protein [Polyangiaceae bacterium]|nr:polyprenyl synthetase family protein [Polyangiaceae bacterium]
MSAATSGVPTPPYAGKVEFSFDLQREDLPSAENTAERWAVVCHLTTDEGDPISVSISFDRRQVDRVGERFAHVVRWGLFSPTREIYESGIDLDSTEWLHPLQRANDGSAARALAELLLAQRVPAPEQRMVGRPWVEAQKLELHYGGSLLARESDGCYRAVVGLLRGDRGIELYVLPAAPPVRWIPGGAWDQEFDVRCIIRNCRVDGALWLARRERLVTGHAHYERAYRRATGQRAAIGNPAVDRTSCELNVCLADGTTIHAYTTQEDPGDPASMWRGAALVTSAHGIATPYDEVSLEVLRSWRSTRSYYEYPVCVALRLPKADVDLKLEAVVSSQEQLAAVSGTPSWSGHMKASGSVAGRFADGVAWMIRSGAQHRDANGFFGAVNRHARSSVESLLANPGSPDSLRAFVGCDDCASSLPSVDEGTLNAALLDPLRDMVGRGGKSWRSFALLASIDAVGSDSEAFAPWSAVPELIHAGSLIVDDVEDQSAIRRGRPSSHRLFGEPIAINAGTAAYFLAELALRRCRLPASAAMRINQLYFSAMRAGHAGQALDLANLQEATRVALAKDEFDELEQRVHAINRLKTGVPGGAFSRMGAIAGGGSLRQTEALGAYFETVATAFQIVDDVLNLRGFKGDLKQRGEDIRLGKVTLPVVKAFGLLDADVRRRLWEIVSARSSDPNAIDEAIDIIEGCGALQRCVDLARSLVHNAWSALDPVLPDSFVKLSIRAFGLYVLDRQS